MQTAGRRWRRDALWWLLLMAAALLLVWGRRLILLAVAQLASGALVALAALPLMKLLEKKLKPSLAAAVSLAGLGAGLVAALLLFAPPLLQQARQLLALAPSAAKRAAGWLRQGEEWLRQSGVPVDGAIRQTLVEKGEQWLGNAAPALLGWAQQRAGGLSRWMLAPLFGFYFLRDRRQIGRWLMLLLPVGWRGITLRFLGEVRRELTGYLRGQLLLSLAVGGLTAAGLLMCGIPAWLALGAAMGVLELIPYVGPVAGGALVMLFGLQSGWVRMLWALAVVLAVQQLEGSWLSPKMMSDATRLHPMAVVLSLLLGGSAAGVAGILLAVPLVLCLRTAYRVWSLSRSRWARQAEAFVKER